MAVREIARRLIDGVWQTVDAEESSNGGSQPVTVKGPYTIDFDTAGFLNAADNGLLLCAVAAGSLVRVVGCVTTQFTGTMVNPEIDVVLATAVDSVASFLAIYDATDNPSGAALGAYREMPPLPARLASPLYGFANVACNVYVGLYPASGTPNAGTAKFYVEMVAATAP